MGWLSDKRNDFANWKYKEFGPPLKEHEGVITKRPWPRADYQHLSDDQVADWFSFSEADQIADRDDIRAIGEARWFEPGFTEAEREYIIDGVADRLGLDDPVPPSDTYTPPAGSAY